MADIQCPVCGSKNINVYRGVYMGDSGCEHKGFVMECADCIHTSGWWSTLEECRIRFED